MEKVAERGFQYAKAILHTSGEVNATGLFKVFGRTSDFSNLKTCIKYLGNNLVVENEIVAQYLVITSLQNLPAVSPVSSMVFA